MSQAITWDEGDTLTFDWAFLAWDNDYLGWSNKGPDFAKFRLFSNAAILHEEILADVVDVGNYGETGWMTTSYTFLSDGNGFMHWTVDNGLNALGSNRSYGGDDDYLCSGNSRLLLDNIAADPGPQDQTPVPDPDPPTNNPIPEPTTFLLLGIGLVGLAGAEVRRRRKKTKQ